MRKRYIFIAVSLLLPMVLLASGTEHGESGYYRMTGREDDFWPRVFNFTIFASILFYLLKNVIGNFFKDRKAGISKQLTEIEERLQAAKEAKKEADAKLKESQKKAKEIVADAKKEAILLSDNIMNQNLLDLEYLEKQFIEKQSLESRKKSKETIGEILNENITADDIQIDEKKVIDIIKGKVA
ncbi:MAG: F0F1 ATP synthase subunit B [Campylobacterales bacterium]|nr:F0F1 ATP synthase subunit B [Campylobacterales bacterium]